MLQAKLLFERRQDNTSLNLGGDGKFDSMGMYKLTSINLMKDNLVRAKLITSAYQGARIPMSTSGNFIKFFQNKLFIKVMNA